LPDVSSEGFPDNALVLTTLCDDPSVAGNRSIRIVHESGDAVRTDDFFFVRTILGNGTDRSALYAKPEDVWNVHDLSHEYPDVVEEFRRQLTGAAVREST